MKLLFVARMAIDKGATASVASLIGAGRRFGDDVSLYSASRPELPHVPCLTDLRGLDGIVFVVHGAKDLPDLPHLGELLDHVPKSRRVLIDCCGRYNDTVCSDEDSNHLEEFEGHAGWEWIQAFDAISGRIFQPTNRPKRSNVRPFLFHGFEPSRVLRPYTTAAEAAAAWQRNGDQRKPHDLVFVGNNFQKWSQLRAILESTADRIEPGRVKLVGRDWAKRPKWAISRHIAGVDVDPALIQRLGVAVSPPVPFEHVIARMSEGRFCPVVHRPVFNSLGLVTIRTFETFSADTLPILFQPKDFVELLYGPAALRLTPENGVAELLADAERRPSLYWEAVLETRAHLSARHSYDNRWLELRTALGC